jgi:CheY-like chemotaxis protein
MGTSGDGDNDDPGAGGGAATATGVGRIRVLVVDDDADFRDSIRQVLEWDGYEVVTADDGQGALELLRAGTKVDLIILDLLMPKKSGWQMHEELQRDPELAPIPLVVMTSSGLRQGALGPVPILPKNISAIVLLRKVAGAVAKKR